MPCSHLPPADLSDPLRVEDAHLPETVLLLARGIATDLGFDRLPILADALEDAGCDNFALLNHLRSDEPHRVDCWALRRLLRTTLMLPGGVPMTFAYCPPGTFLMGSPESERLRDVDELQHEVQLTRGFYTGVHTVTQKEWSAVMGTDPSHFKATNRPVESVSWHDSQAFCEKVRELSGKAIRLPTEAEWEYAARGGTTTPFYWGSELNGTQSNSGPGYPYGTEETTVQYLAQTTPGGWYADEFPHPWGLTDVIGNVWEWCSDWSVGNYYWHTPVDDPECREGINNLRVLRGGSWDTYSLHHCRVAFRGKRDASARESNCGFRVVFTA